MFHASTTVMRDVIQHSQSAPVYGIHVTVAENNRKNYPPMRKGQTCLEVDYTDGRTLQVPLHYTTSESKVETTSNITKSVEATIAHVTATCKLYGAHVIPVGNGLLFET